MEKLLLVTLTLSLLFIVSHAASIFSQDHVISKTKQTEQEEALLKRIKRQSNNPFGSASNVFGPALDAPESKDYILVHFELK